MSVMYFISVKYLNLDTGIIIVRAKRGCHLMVQTTLTFISKIKDYDIMLHTLHTGGKDDYIENHHIVSY